MSHKHVRKFWKSATILIIVLTLFTMMLQPAFAQTSATPQGYVTMSFVDYAIRDQYELDEGSVDFPNQLKVIVPPTQVPFYEYETIADVTLRLLDMKGIGYSHSGSTESAFYLAAIKNFKSGGKTIASFGEFDAGTGSGWMITLNNWFINMSAAEFAVADGDVVRWQYTCQLGADIGNDWSNGSAKITGLRIDAKYGTLSPKFSDSVRDYSLSVPANIDSIRIEALQENYWSILTYRVGNTYYKLLRDIPVSGGTKIIIESAFAEYAGNEPSDTDKVTITIVKSAEASTTPGSTSEPGTTLPWTTLPGDITLPGDSNLPGDTNSPGETNSSGGTNSPGTTSPSNSASGTTMTGSTTKSSNAQGSVSTTQKRPVDKAMQEDTETSNIAQTGSENAVVKSQPLVLILFLVAIGGIFALTPRRKYSNL